MALKSSYRWPPKLWEHVLVRAQEGHAPSFAAIVYWGRLRQEKRIA